MTRHLRQEECAARHVGSGKRETTPTCSRNQICFFFMMLAAVAILKPKVSAVRYFPAPLRSLVGEQRGKDTLSRSSSTNKPLSSRHDSARASDSSMNHCNNDDATQGSGCVWRAVKTLTRSSSRAVHRRRRESTCLLLRLQPDVCVYAEC